MGHSSGILGRFLQRALMRILLISAGSLLATTAAAQQVPNGDFENGMASWSDASSDICNFACDDGSSSIIDEADTDGNFPSPTSAMRLVTGSEDGGFGQDKTFGRTRSVQFMVTWKTLGWEQVSDGRNQLLSVEIFTAVGGQVAKDDVDPSVDSWSSGAIDIAPACGQDIAVEITGMLDNGGWGGSQVSLWDDVEQGGAPCDQYVDNDGDGVCLEGIDLDGDGNCASEGEPDEGINDCDDDDADIFPGAEDIGGNGIDENCDGLDEDAGPTDPGTTDPGTNMPTDDDDGEANLNNEGVIAAGGAGCACNSGGSSPIGLLVLLSLALIRRR